MSKVKRSRSMSRIEGLKETSDLLNQDPSRVAITEDYRVKSRYKSRPSNMKESMGRHDLYKESALDSRSHVLSYDSRAGNTGEAEEYKPIMGISKGLESDFEPVSDKEKLFYAYDISKDDDMTFADLEQQIDRLETVVDLNTSITIPSDTSDKEPIRPAFSIMQHLLWRVNKEEQRAGALLDRIDRERGVLEKLRRDFHAELQRQAASFERRLSKNFASLSDTSSDAFANEELPPRGRSLEQYSNAVPGEILVRPKTKGAGAPLQDLLLSEDGGGSSHSAVVTESTKPVTLVGHPSASALPLTTVLDRVREIISDCHIKSMPRLYL